jgi:hypothetical protein
MLNRELCSQTTSRPLTQQTQLGECADGYCTSRKWPGGLAEESWIDSCSCQTLKLPLELYTRHPRAHKCQHFDQEPMSSLSPRGALGEPARLAILLLSDFGPCCGTPFPPHPPDHTGLPHEFFLLEQKSQVRRCPGWAWGGLYGV